MVKRKSFSRRPARARSGFGAKRIFKTAKRNKWRIGLQRKVNSMYRMIETKDAQWKTNANISLAHNNVTVLQASAGGYLNPFSMINGPENADTGSNGKRIGDQINVRGMSIRAFFENALSRSKVYYRLMLVKAAKGDVPTRDTLFKNNVTNKMIDMTNGDRFTIIAQRVFNVQPPVGGYAASGVDAAGVPTGVVYAGLCTKTIKMWIPGRKFGRGGRLQFESENQRQLKFFDYYLCVVCYDWFGTPQDINTVGKINELYTKIYFKDA